MTTALSEIQIAGLKRFRRGKVRDTYDLGDRLLMVASDRMSAFDVVLPDAIPDKGAVLTQLSRFWFERTGEVVPNHLISTDVADLPEEVAAAQEVLRGRFMIVKKAERIDIECVVRGYLAGSGWAEYRKSNTVCGERLPDGLTESARLPEPIFTPAAKVDEGHDENISYGKMKQIVGRDLAERLKDASMQLYAHAEAHARTRGIIIADTKFEFGLVDGELIVIDEVLTPDSSRFWEASQYEAGRSQASFDKQPLRDWLERSGWDKNPPGPPLPGEIIDETAARYRKAYELITGTEFSIA
ncbi:MAG TPA: phosphoribosylaminoimidazolesuccinocarboxamide synthase [Thermomicrobiales bacterium]|nr:phosphoribosylaminoimidazolesuccinocarboxamide synthase [Thermomicrobiales bacterium]